MKKQFIPYRLALKLKELGFDERCLASYWKTVTDTILFETEAEYECSASSRIYDSEIKAPLWQQAFDWFMEKGCLVDVDWIWQDRKTGKINWTYNIQYTFEKYVAKGQEFYSPLPMDEEIRKYDSIELAKEAALERLIELHTQKVI